MAIVQMAGDELTNKYCTFDPLSEGTDADRPSGIREPLMKPMVKEDLPHAVRRALKQEG